MPNITKRGDSFRIRAFAGTDSTGKQIMRSMTWQPAPGMTEKQIEKELNRQATLFEEKVSTGQYMDGSIKFQDFAEQWFKDYAEDHLKERTLDRYKRLAQRTYIAIGHIKLDKLQPQHLLSFYKQLQQIEKGCSYSPKSGFEKRMLKAAKNQKSFAALAGLSPQTVHSVQLGNNVSGECAQKICAALGVPVESVFNCVHSGKRLSPKTIKHYHAFISSVLDRAVKWQVIKENPCSRVDAPKVDHKRVACMDEVQISQFINCLQDESIEYQAIFLLLILTGMRRGELLGLEWPDFDFDKKIVRISRTSQYTCEKGIYTDTTKTEGSNRPLAIPAELVALLRKYRAEQSQRRLQLGDRWSHEWAQQPRLFTQWDGTPMHPNAPYQEMQKILKRNGMPQFSLHSLRHTNATLLIGAGTDVRTVSGRLGHSQTSTTMNIYAEYLQSANSAASETLADVLIRKKTI